MTIIDKIRRGKYPQSLLLVLVALFITNCEKKETTPDPEIKESFQLSVAPENYLFPAEGGELIINIKATKHIASVIDGDTIDHIINDVSFSVSLSGNGFSISENTISAEPNPGDRRKGTLVATIDGTDTRGIIHLTQRGVEDDEEDDNDENDDENGQLPSMPGQPY